MPLIELLERAESFISGFEGDDTQEESVDGLLAEMRAAIARGAPTLAVVIEGGTLSAVISDDAQAARELLKRVVLIDYDVEGSDEDGLVKIDQFEAPPCFADVGLCSIDEPEIDLAKVLADFDALNEFGESDAASE